MGLHCDQGAKSPFPMGAVAPWPLKSMLKQQQTFKRKSKCPWCSDHVPMQKCVFLQDIQGHLKLPCYLYAKFLLQMYGTSLQCADLLSVVGTTLGDIRTFAVRTQRKL